MHRYFIGISLPLPFSLQIVELHRQHYDARFMLHPLVPHITLLPPSIVASLEPYEFAAAISKATADFLPLTIELSHIGTFGQRVVYVSVESTGLPPLRGAVVELLPTELQLRLLQERPFEPHLTLAQAKQFQTLSEHTIGSVSQTALSLLPQTFEIQNLTLFQWQAPRTYATEAI